MEAVPIDAITNNTRIIETDSVEFVLSGDGRVKSVDSTRLLSEHVLKRSPEQRDEIL